MAAEQFSGKALPSTPRLPATQTESADTASRIPIWPIGDGEVLAGEIVAAPPARSRGLFSLSASETTTASLGTPILSGLRLRAKVQLPLQPNNIPKRTSCTGALASERRFLPRRALNCAVCSSLPCALLSFALARQHL